MPETAYQVTLGDRVFRVVVRHAEDQVFVRIDDGPEQPVHLSEVRGALHSLSTGDRHVELLAAGDGERVRLALGGRQYVAHVLDEAHARLANVAAARGAGHKRHELRAPMPGLLVRVLCQVGDQVEPGKPLAVLQAMKMENELSLAYGGAVTQVNAEVGQTVEQGQVLVVVE